MERTRGLGRGLGALIGEQDAMRPREAVYRISFSAPSRSAQAAVPTDEDLIRWYDVL